MANKPIEQTCHHCGGTEVSIDAWADWDARAQSWVVRETFPTAYCHNCQGETRLIEREIAPAD